MTATVRRLGDHMLEFVSCRVSMNREGSVSFNKLGMHSCEEAVRQLSREISEMSKKGTASDSVTYSATVKSRFSTQLRSYTNQEPKQLVAILEERDSLFPVNL